MSSLKCRGNGFSFKYYNSCSCLHGIVFSKNEFLYNLAAVLKRIPMHKKNKCEELGGEFARLTKTSVKPPKYREMGSGMTDFWDNVNLHKEN